MNMFMMGTMSLLFIVNFVYGQFGIQAMNNPVELAVVIPLQPEMLPGPNKASGDEGKVSQDDPMRSKLFSKSFPMDSRDRLSLYNKYGDMIIKVWDKKEARVDVDIKAYSKDAGDAQRLLDQTVIEAGKSGTEIAFKTSIATTNGEYGSKMKNGKSLWRRGIRVNYVVYMPPSNALAVLNQYGDVSMGNFSGPLNIKIQYGNFSAGSLNGNDNNLNVQYGKTTVQEINGAVIKQQYGSGLTLGTVGTLELRAQYTAVTINSIKKNANIKQEYGQGLNIRSAENLDLDVQYANVSIGSIIGNANVKQQYNNLSIESANKVNLNAQYTTVKINRLSGDGSFKVGYDKLTIENIGPGSKSLNVDAAYVRVALSFNGNYHGDFDVNVGYSEFKYGSGIFSKLVSDQSNKKYYNGRIGKGGGGKVTVKSEYGGLSFN